VSQPYEPFVILDRRPEPGAPAPLRGITYRGRKPSILLVDRDGAQGAELDHPLAQEGFDVYRTTGRDSALALLEAHPSIVMVMVRMDVSDLDPISLIQALQDSRPGIWVGMLSCRPVDRIRAAEGYAAGAADLFCSAADTTQMVDRLVRSVPRAFRLREAADRRAERSRKRRALSWLRGSPTKRRGLLEMIATVVLAGVLGAAMASASRSWMDAQELWNARVERWFSALSAPAARGDSVDRPFDRWYRFEQLNLQRQSQQAQGRYYDHQLEQERLRDLFRNVAPQYPGH
jgi:ActR/RegA family two-component response regulator